MLDVPIARDTARIGQRLLDWMRGRLPTLTLCVGHSAGAQVNNILNAGIDPARANALTGDNFVRPYDPTSGRIYDGFISLAGGAVPVDPLRGISARTLFLVGEADSVAVGATRQVKELIDQGIDASAWTRIYMVRNMPHIDADLVIALGRFGLDYTNVTGRPREYFMGGGERLKGVSAALLDALKRWIVDGTPPPASRFNGARVDSNSDGVVDALAFPQADAPPTSLFPYVDDPAQDAISGSRSAMTLAANPLLLSRWLGAQDALASHPDSLLLTETACRRGRFTLFTQGPVGTWFTPDTEQLFLARWGSSAAHQSCRVRTVEALIEQGFYDPRVVTIDIQPSTFPNVIDPGAGGEVAVAIFSTIGFDATTINPATLALGGTSLPGIDAGRQDVGEGRDRRVPPTRIEDVNGDGRLDMVVEFPVGRLTFNDHDIVAEVWGETKGGMPFSGIDLVQVVR